MTFCDLNFALNFVFMLTGIIYALINEELHHVKFKNEL